MGRVFDMFCQSVLSPLFHHIIELAEEGSEASWNWDHWHGVHYFFYILFFVFFLSRRGRLARLLELGPVARCALSQKVSRWWLDVANVVDLVKCNKVVLI